MKHLLFAAATVAASFPADGQSIYTKIVIQASPEKVWTCFSDTDSYPAWNPLIQSLEGPWEVGHKLKATINGTDFKPRVLVSASNSELTWKGRLLIPGLFDGTHRFELVDNGDGTTTFIHSETFSGLLVPLLKKKLDQEIQPLFEAMNEALKARVEESQR